MQPSLLIITEKTLLEKLNLGEIEDLREILHLEVTDVEYPDGSNLELIFKLSEKHNVLRGLIFLSLSSNRLTTLPEGLFKGLYELRIIYLNDNRLITLPEKLFQGLVCLKELHLEKNNFAVLPKGLLKGLVNLEGLWLNDNRLISLPDLGAKPGVRLFLGRNFQLQTDGDFLCLEDSNLRESVFGRQRFLYSYDLIFGTFSSDVYSRLILDYSKDDPDVLKLIALSLRGDPKWPHHFTETQKNELNALYELRQKQFQFLGDHGGEEMPSEINALIFSFAYNAGSSSMAALSENAANLSEDKREKRSRSNFEPEKSPIKQSLQKRPRMC